MPVFSPPSPSSEGIEKGKFVLFESSLPDCLCSGPMLVVSAHESRVFYIDPRGVEGGVAVPAEYKCASLVRFVADTLEEANEVFSLSQRLLAQDIADKELLQEKMLQRRRSEVEALINRFKLERQK